MANRLRKLVIDEVSSVPKGAGIGCRVLLKKSHAAEDNNPMSLAEEILKSNPEAQSVAIAEKAMADRDAGHISEWALNGQMQFVAKYFHQNDLAKMLDGPAGAVFKRPRAARFAADENASVMKREGHFAKQGNVYTESASDEDANVPWSQQTNETSDEANEPWEARVKALMTKHSISEDAAITMLYRQEKLSKRLPW